MLTQLTTFGVTLMQTATAPIVLTSYKLGSAFNYVPTVNQTNIQGSQIATGVPSNPVVETTNFVRYYVELAASAGPYAFGEIGLFYGSNLFAICVLDSAMTKEPLNPNNNTGGAIVIDFNVPAVGQNYQMWTNTAQSNTYKVSQIAGPEELPQVPGNSPNIYVVDSTNGTKPFLAYTDRNGLWSFDSYSEIGGAPAIAVTQQTLTISAAAAQALEINAGTVNNTLLQVVDGDGYASVRWVETATLDGGTGNLVLDLNAPIFRNLLVNAGLQFYRLGSPTSSTINVSAQLTIKTVGPNYQLVMSDKDAVFVKVVSSSPTNVYIPDNATVAFPIGTNLLVGWGGAGQVGIAPANGSVTIKTPSTNQIAQQEGKIALVQTAINVWELEGNLQQL